ncbi:MAG: hypothetical protein ACN4GM_09575 [Gammaproteobacteria bacterium]
MDIGRFYRINIKFLEPDKLSQDFRSEFQDELDRNAIYLGVRHTPTNYNGSVAINSLELANQCVILAKECLLDEYGKIECYIREFPCVAGYMKSIIDTDTRTLMNHIQNTNFTSKANKTLLQKVRSMTG